ncbi:hypothetical protein Tco_0738481 [Tanacetum coccineum]
MYVPPPSITIVRPWFAMIRYNGEIRVKGTLKKSCLPPRWRLLMGQIIQCLGGKIGGLDQISNKDATILYCLANDVQVFSVHNEILKPKPLLKNIPHDHPPMKAICYLDDTCGLQAPEISSPTEEVPQGKKPGARSRLKRKQSSKHTSKSTTEASKS